MELKTLEVQNESENKALFNVGDVVDVLDKKSPRARGTIKEISSDITGLKMMYIIDIDSVYMSDYIVCGDNLLVNESDLRVSSDAFWRYVVKDI